MAKKAIEALSLDELDERSTQLKREVAALNEERDRLAAVRARKVQMRNAEEALKAAGVEGVALSPAPASLTTEMGQVS